MKQEFIFVVIPNDGGDPSAFGSISAIFDVFSPEEIGATVRSLWGAISVGKPFVGDKVMIHKLNVKRKKQKK